MEYLKVVLLQKLGKLGCLGDIVRVRPGFARNYLLPKKMALRATKENIRYFEDRKAHIEEVNADARAKAQVVAEKMRGLSISVVRQASEKGQLYGSVTRRDLAAAMKNINFEVTANQINLNVPIKFLGVYDVSVDLHPEVSVSIRLSVAKSEEEAGQQIQEVAAEPAEA
ncbi:MAG: 50S ribosomal protein L9 [Holosporaceae bacterium]|nr:50S ribosomal protein L9 [Holosporaceae bacterium]